MINKINLAGSIKSFVKRNFKNDIKFNLPRLKFLSKDVFERKNNMPEVLSYNPQIFQSEFHSGIKDFRFVSFGTEYRAYNYEGYDTKFPNNYVCIDSKGDRRLKPHIYLNLVEVKPEYARQGVYSEAIKKLEDSALAEEGCEGRIILEARKIEAPYITKIPSPSIAHWKCGFKFVNEDKNKIMERVVNGELPLEEAPEGTMYYVLN